MISALVAGSAWMKPPVDGPAEGVSGAAAALETPLTFAVPAAPAGLTPSGVPGVEAAADTAAAAAAAARRARAEGGAQHGRELRRVGVLQVDDPDVAGRGRALQRQVELGDQGAQARHPRRVRAANDQRIAARVDQDRRRRERRRAAGAPGSPPGPAARR